MPKGRNDRPRAGRQNAAQTRPPEQERSQDDERQLPRAGRLSGGPTEAGADGSATGEARPVAAGEPTERGLLEGGFDPGLADLGDDVARGAEDGGSPRAPARGTLEGGIDAGLTDLGDDVARGAEEGGSPRAPARGTLEGGIDAGLTDLGEDGDLPVDLDDDGRQR